MALPTVFGCHQRFARDAEHYLKSVAYSQFSPTPPSQPHFKPRNFSCAYFLPTTAFTRTQKVRPASAHKLSYPGMLPRARNLAPLLNTQHTPFRAPLPSTPANAKQPHPLLLAQANPARCLTPHARILSAPEMRDYRTHAHVHLCLLSYGLHSSSIHNPAHALNGLTVFPRRPNLPLTLNYSPFRSSD